MTHEIDNKTGRSRTICICVLPEHIPALFVVVVLGVATGAPDLSMIGYLVNSRVGALAYNIAHHKGVAVICYLIGIYTASNELQFTGLLLLGHSSMDRVFGYGLKYSDSFHNTHLGRIGKDT